MVKKLWFSQILFVNWVSRTWKRPCKEREDLRYCSPIGSQKWLLLRYCLYMKKKVFQSQNFTSFENTFCSAIPSLPRLRLRVLNVLFCFKNTTTKCSVFRVLQLKHFAFLCIAIIWDYRGAVCLSNLTKRDIMSLRHSHCHWFWTFCIVLFKN